MDDDEGYVPNMAMEAGGFPFASDLSSDSYVPPPPTQPDPHHQQPPYFHPHHHMQQQQMIRPQMMPPNMGGGAGGGGKKKKMTKAQQQAAAASLPPPQYQQQQQQQHWGQPQAAFHQPYPQHQGYGGAAYGQPVSSQAYAQQQRGMPQQGAPQYAVPGAGYQGYPPQQHQPPAYPGYPTQPAQAGYPASSGYPQGAGGPSYPGQPSADSRYPGYPGPAYPPTSTPRDPRYAQYPGGPAPGYPQQHTRHPAYAAQYPKPGGGPQQPLPPQLPPQHPPTPSQQSAWPPQAQQQHAQQQHQRAAAFAEIQSLQHQIEALQSQPQTQQSMMQIQSMNQRLSVIQNSMEGSGPGYPSPMEQQSRPSYPGQQQPPPAYTAQLHHPQMGQVTPSQQGPTPDPAAAERHRSGSGAKSETPPPPVPSIHPSPGPSVQQQQQQPPQQQPQPGYPGGAPDGRPQQPPSSMSVMLHETGGSGPVQVNIGGGGSQSQPAAIISLYPYPVTSQSQSGGGGAAGSSPGAVPPEPIPTPPNPNSDVPNPSNLPMAPPPHFHHQAQQHHMARPPQMPPGMPPAGYQARGGSYPGPRPQGPFPGLPPHQYGGAPGAFPPQPHGQMMQPVMVSTSQSPYGAPGTQLISPPTPASSDPSGGEETPKPKGKRGPRKKKPDDGSPQKSPARRGRPPKVRPPVDGAPGVISPGLLPGGPPPPSLPSPLQQAAPPIPLAPSAALPPFLHPTAASHAPPPGAPTQQKLPVPVFLASEDPAAAFPVLPPPQLPQPFLPPQQSVLMADIQPTMEAPKPSISPQEAMTSAETKPPMTENVAERMEEEPLPLEAPTLAAALAQPPILPASLPTPMKEEESEEASVSGDVTPISKPKYSKKSKKAFAFEFESVDSPATPPVTQKEKAKRPKYQEKKKKSKKRKKEDYELSEGEEEAVAAAVAAVEDNSIPDELKRRSARTTGKRKKYAEEEAMPDFDLSDDDDKISRKPRDDGDLALPKPPSVPKEPKKPKKKKEKVETELITMEELDEEPPPQFALIKEDELMVVEKILLHRKAKKPVAAADAQPSKLKQEEEEDDEEGDTEYLVKFKNFSYPHCEWKLGTELDIVDKRFIGKAKRYHAKRDNATTFTDEQYDEDEPFNPDYLQIERVLDVSTEIIPKPSWAWVMKKGRKRKAKEDAARRVKEAVAAAETARKAERQAALAKAAAEKEAAARAAAQAELGGEAVLTGPMEETPKEPSSEVPSEAPSVADEASKDAPPSEATKDSMDETSQDATPAPESKAGDDEEESDEEEDNDSPQGLTHYLCKWRSLQYEDATWEVAADVEAAKIEEFEARRVPTEWQLKEKPRPSASDWRKSNDFPVFKNDNELREYQQEGLNWLLFCWYNKQNCILADEMGLGKTIQTMTFLHEIQAYGVHGPFLVIAPLSTIHNWQRECETWTDLNCVVYHGTSMSRGMIAEYEMFFRDEKKDERLKGVFKFDMLITTYEMILVDCEALKEIPWRICVIDEAHRLKNRNCSLLKGLAQFRMEHRVLLTGTPLQNNIEELFSLLNFLEPKQFSSSNAFLAEFGNCQSDEQVSKIQDILKPMMLRRLKEDVEKSLKPKEETIVEVELTNIQKKYYRAILEKNFSYLSRGASAPSLMNTMMELRKCCNHPFLITGAEEQIMDDYRREKRSEKLDDDTIFHSTLIQSSGKLVLCDKLLPRLRKEGHKVLIFSQMVKVLNLIEDYLIDKRYPFERIDGNVRGSDRQAAIDRFSKPDSDRFVFLLCTRAGGLGINLTAADTVIIYDSDWNPQNDLQAQARCHRIGQQKMVKIYRLITRNTYEREMFDKASLKLGLDKAVLQSTGTKDNCAAQLSKKEVEELLRKGAYAAVMDDASEGDKFCEEDIDQILQRRTQTITVQAGVKGSTFAKASFNVSGNREDIDVNDPNFWQKWAKKANVDTPDPTADLIIYEPRMRKRRFADDMYNQMGGSEDSDSDSDGGKGGASRKRGRPNPDGDLDYAPDELAFNKTDYFKVEKLLGTFGWGRWKEIQKQCELKTDVSTDDVAHMCRTVLLHCLRNFTGDDKIREFIWELIRPPDATDEEHKSFSALKKSQAEAGRGGGGGGGGGRKSSRIAQNEKVEAEKELMDMYHQGWAALPAYNPPVMAVDNAYQRHLQRHANKVMLRVKLLYYLKEEVIGNLDVKIDAGMPSEAIELDVPWHPELPASWWDTEADKSLLIGIHKHGYESFTAMLDDPCLAFLDRCGPSEFEEEKAAKAALEVATEEDEEAKKAEYEAAVEAGKLKRAGLLPFPSVAELNARFRRLVTLFQRSSKLSQAREEQRARRAHKQEHIQAILQERELRRLEERQKWSRREETDFYRGLCSFGVEQDPETGEYRWERFRQIARVENKFDHTLTEHYTAFHAMCKRITGKPLSKAEEAVSYITEPVSEDRATRVLARVELMARVRGAIRHPKLGERIKLCRKTPDLPLWWDSPLHDADLLIGVAKHGLTKSEDTIVQDPDLNFLEIWQKYQKNPGALAKELEAAVKAADEAETKTNGDKEDKADSADKETPKLDESAKKDAEPEAAENVLDESEKKEDAPVENEKTSSEYKPKEDEETADKNGNGEDKEEGEKKNGEVPEKDAKEGGDAEKEAESVPKAIGDTDVSISQMLAQASGNSMQWPKERMVIFRIQNICQTIESGEWPASAASKGSGSLSAVNSDLDNRSTTPESTRGTPFDSDIARDSPLYNFGTFAKPPRSGGRSQTPKLAPSGLLSASSGRKGRKSKGAPAASNPLQDLMESEREKMRVLMHQSFLQQLEQFPLAAAMAMSGGNPGAFPPGLLDCLGLPPGMPGLPSNLGGAAGTSADKAVEEVLNLSTKAKAKDEKASSSSVLKAEHKPLSMNDMMAMSTLPGETRVPVLSLKDGKRLTGKDAPMIKNLAAWLSDHPHHIIDMPPQGIAGLFGDLEPGEIPRPGPKTPAKATTPAASSTSSSGGLTWEERITVINRKNGLKLSGSKAPQMKNLIMWLEKNPDWDVDPSQASGVKSKLKLPEKLRSRCSTKLTSPEAAPPKKASSRATPTQAAAAVDPLASLLGGAHGIPGLDAATQQQLQIQMQLMMMGMGGAGNPGAMLGLPPSLLSPDLAGLLGAGFNPAAMGGIPGFPSFSAAPTASAASPAKDSRPSSSKTKEPAPSTPKSSKTSTPSSSRHKSSAKAPSSSSQAAKDAAAAAQQLQNMSEDPFGLGALSGLDPSALNPFLGLPIPTSSAASGIFGNPFLGGAGMMGTAGLPPNLAAMAQLQSLMGLEGLGAAGFPPGLFPPTSVAASTTPSAPKRKPKPKETDDAKLSGSGGSITAGTSAVGAAKSGGRKKLNALVEKLAESAAQASSDSPPSSKAN